MEGLLNYNYVGIQPFQSSRLLLVFDEVTVHHTEDGVQVLVVSSLAWS